MLHFHQDHHQTHHHEVDQGCCLLLCHCHLHYGKEVNLHGGMDNSLGSVEAMVVYSFCNNSKGRKI
jgi:hypothetical protein